MRLPERAAGKLLATATWLPISNFEVRSDSLAFLHDGDGICRSGRTVRRRTSGARRARHGSSEMSPCSRCYRRTG